MSFRNRIFPGAANPPTRPGRWRRKSAAACLSMLIAQASYAADATLLTSAICDNPRDAIDYFWLAQKYGASDLFFMKTDGSVVFLQGANSDFNSHNKVYIAAHGNKGNIANFTIADFNTYFKAAHATTPDLAYFDSCEAAKGPDSNMKKFNTKYGGLVKKLEGPVGLCQLVGNGDATLANALYKYDATPSNSGQFGTIVGNIVNDWTNGNYKGSGNSFQKTCNDLMSGFDGPQVLAFVNEVYDHYTTAPAMPLSTTINYLQLIRLNAGGTDFLVCGTDNGVACP